MSSVSNASIRALPNAGITAAVADRSPALRALSYLIHVPAGAIATLVSPKLERVLVAIVLLNVPLQIEKHFFVREDARDLGSIGGLGISVTTIALAGLYLAWLVEAAVRRRPLPVAVGDRLGVILPAALFVLVSATSLLFAEDAGLGGFAVWSSFEELLVCLYIARFVTGQRDVSFVLRLLSIGLILESALMLAQAAGLAGDIDFYGFKARADFAGSHRISGTLGSPNPAAAYLAMMIGLVASSLFSRQSRGDKCLAAIGLAGAILALIFTLSRGGWCAFLVGFAMLMTFGGSRVRRKGAVVVGLLIILFVLPLAPAIHERLTGDDNGAGAARMPLNRLAIAMIADHPLLGIGANNFPLAMQPYVAHNFSGEFLYCVHNSYLLVCSETGIIGCLVFVWFLAGIVRQGLKRTGTRGAFGMTALGCSAAVTGLMVQMNLDPLRTGAATHLLWLFAGLVVAINAIDREGNLSTKGLDEL
jgi:O-antigen ligase